MVFRKNSVGCPKVRPPFFRACSHKGIHNKLRTSRKNGHEMRRKSGMTWRYSGARIRRRRRTTLPQSLQEITNRGRNADVRCCRKPPDRRTHRSEQLPVWDTAETAEKVFGHGVVVKGASAGHVLTDAICFQTFPESPGGVLHAPVAVEDGSAAAVRHVQSRQG